MRTYLTLFLLLPLSCAYGQLLTADAGKDTTFCESVPGLVILGGTPAASGGSNVYSYHWDIYPKPYIQFPSAPSLRKYCSDYLNDTTSANPNLIWSLPTNEDSLIFILTVTDDSGQVAIDSVFLIRIGWAVALGYTIITTFPGDTQTITPAPFSLGFRPYTYDWGTSDSLIGNRFDFNVNANFYRSRKVIIPEVTYKMYAFTVTESYGCSKKFGMWEHFRIFPVSAKSIAGPNNTIILFPNPAKDQLIASSANEKISSVIIRDLSGSVVLVPKINNTPIKIDLSGLPNGMYFVTVGTSSRIITKKIFKISN